MRKYRTSDKGRATTCRRVARWRAEQKKSPRVTHTPAAEASARESVAPSPAPVALAARTLKEQPDDDPPDHEAKRSGIQVRCSRCHRFGRLVGRPGLAFATPHAPVVRAQRLRPP